MFTRHLEKRRFQLDVPHPSRNLSRGSYVTARLPSVSRRKRRRFRIGPPDVSHLRARWQALTPQAALGRLRARGRALTLGERRQLTRLGMLASALVLLSALISGALLLNPQSREALFPSSAS